MCLFDRETYSQDLKSPTRVLEVPSLVLGVWLSN
jgi:hypothetical protein